MKNLSTYVFHEKLIIKDRFSYLFLMKVQTTLGKYYLDLYTVGSFRSFLIEILQKLYSLGINA